ncbi:hypothetical protein DC522_13805 [Microvirga sp. KLBC 81]|uniref:hypothetical protein n=1 Tax=Microvirga sp. KLBC 81 TaxID=1862707 RepID=UPI000D50BEAC|nr:hypothetical protein [Microvirga sp. KLBC 81]PVE23842.1 hypothetical protein DC522_13805 [Microvirga sp. KLBC 81]
MKHILAFLFLCLAPIAQSAAAAPLEPDAARQAAQGVVAEVLDALARKDFTKLASSIGEEGLIVSPYVMIDGGDVRLSRAEVENCATNPQMRRWGEKDGSGDPIEANCSRYFHEFVWNADYRKANEVLYNEPRQRGNEINNNHEFAPNGIVVELHIRGKSIETELEWKILRLIFRRSDQGLSLIAITRDVWTI